MWRRRNWAARSPAAAAAAATAGRQAPSAMMEDDGQNILFKFFYVNHQTVFSKLKKQLEKLKKN
jgi:hypothetical protein